MKNKKISFPIVVKPINEGSSLGVKITKIFKELVRSAKNLLKKYNELIFEQYIGGQKFRSQL